MQASSGCCGSGARKKKYYSTMSNSSIKKNFGYNVILTMSTYIFGLIVFPYVSRVLGVDMIGRVNFADQTVNYFRILAAMGISTVGVREIAACGNDRIRRSKVFSDLFAFILISSLLFVAILVVLTMIVPQWHQMKSLLFTGSFYLFFSALMIEWFYQGTENFKYVSIRSISVKAVYVVLVFLLVKRPEDYLKYYILLTGTIVFNALINLGYSKKFVDLRLKTAHPWRYGKSIWAMGVYMIMLSFFSSFNIVYLGMVKGEHDVGVYTTATKIYGMILGILTAYTSVMLPRMTSLLTENKIDEFKQKIRASFSIVFLLAPPLIAGGVILAPQIISILAGGQYTESILPMQLIMPLVMVVGLAQIWVIQVLLPMKKDRAVVLCAIASAVVGITANLILVNRMSFIGSAIALLCAEITNDVLSLLYALRRGLLQFPLKSFALSVSSFIPYAIICLLCRTLVKNKYLALFLAILCCFPVFCRIKKYCDEDRC